MSNHVQVPDATRQRLDDLCMHFREVRAERGASLRKVAAQTGASFVSLGRFEAGRNPSLGVLCAVLAWLELPMAWLDADAGAPQDGHSATGTAAKGAEAREDANWSSITTQGLSEPEVRDQSAWCWALNPNRPLHCGRLARHDGPHKRGEREWWDNNARQGTAKEDNHGQ